jgi:hypothetical protein
MSITLKALRRAEAPTGNRAKFRNNKGLKIDDFVKSRHSGLSGIGFFCNTLEKKDSGQAGMTTY